MLPLNGPFRPDCIAVPISADRSGKRPQFPLTGSTGRENPIRAKETQMADDNRFKGWLCAVASAALLAVSAAIAPTANAQETRLEVRADKAQSVDLKTAPEVAPVAPPAGLSINRPTIPMADYVALKNAAAARAPGQAKPGAPSAPPATGVTLYTQVGSTNETQS